MFVYEGKLKWYNYAQDELFVIVLPSGPVRLGDSVYLFSQWTVDAKGNKNKNWFSTLTVSDVKNQGSDVTFSMKGSWYSYDITTSGGYENLSVIMKNPQGGVSSPQSLVRRWKSDKELTGTTRVWTGKFKWMDFARNEPAIFIVPDGFGEGKPILSTWQWTKASNGKTKEPSFRSEVQKSVSGLDTDTVKFTYKSYYDINCTWDGKKDQLDVWVKEGGHSEDVGDMVRSAIIERQVHSHDFDPYEKNPEKRELEVRLPQAQASLPRILTPLPFPKGLLETLAHTAAFVDQCGYLAKYAQDHFITLDADYHKALEQIEALKKEIININNTKDELARDRNAAQEAVKKTEEALKDALDKVKKLQEEVAKLNKDIQDDADNDAKARQAFEKVQKNLEDSQNEVKDLKQQLNEANNKLAEKDADIKSYLEKIARLENEVSLLQTAYDVQIKANKDLADEKKSLVLENGTLKDTIKGLQKDVSDNQNLINILKERIQGLSGRLEDSIKSEKEANDKATAAKQALSKAQEELFELKTKGR